LFPVETIFGLVGALLGIFYVFAPFRDPGPNAELKDNPRVKNLLWLLGVPIAALVTDWDRLGLQLSRPQILASYFIGAVTTIFIVLLLFSIYPIVIMKRRIKDDPGDYEGYDSLFLASSFLSFGMARYLQVAKDERERISGLRSMPLGRAHMERIAYANQTLAALIVAVTGWEARHGAESEREALIDRILDAIESVARMGAQNPDKPRLRSNYMDVVAVARAKAGEASAVPFDWPPTAMRTHLLVLRRYNGRTHTRNFGLAVNINAQRDDNLFGAPEAFMTGEAVYIDKQNLKFSRNIPKAVQTTVKQYLHSQPFRTFVSIPIAHHTGTVGIINIESDLPHILGESEDVLRSMTKCVMPYCGLLGQLLASRGG
jgi:hypothetical protein